MPIEDRILILGSIGTIEFSILIDYGRTELIKIVPPTRVPSHRALNVFWQAKKNAT